MEFVFLGDGNDRAYQSFADILNKDNVTYIPDHYSLLSGMKLLLYKIHITPKINKTISLPFKGLWTRYFLKGIKNQDSSDLCFVLFNFWVKGDDDFQIIDYIKNKFPHAKIVWVLRDIISSLTTISHQKPLDVEGIKNRIDLSLSFDYGDCERYGFTYYPLVFSEYNGKLLDMPESDVFFVGMAKDRLTKILCAYEKCTEAGLKCDFHIVGVPDEKQVYKKDIFYNNYMTYNENIQHMLHTKCVLEIMQGGSDGYTQRACEAVFLNKMMLTDNQKMKDAPFYNKEYISIFKDMHDIDDSFLKSIKGKHVIDYCYKHNMSPVHLLEYIENYFVETK